jgi:hypothetical protein
MAGQPGFFDGEERLKALLAAGDVASFAALQYDLKATQPVAQNTTNRRSAIDVRTFPSSATGRSLCLLAKRE